MVKSTHTVEFIDIKKASELTGLATSTLYKLASARKIPFYKPTGKLLFNAEELRSWIERSKQSDLLLSFIAFLFIHAQNIQL